MGGNNGRRTHLSSSVFTYYIAFRKSLWRENSFRDKGRGRENEWMREKERKKEEMDRNKVERKCKMSFIE